MTPPLSHDKAEAIVKAAQDIWNFADINEIGGLFNDDCEWRDNHRHLHNKQSVFDFLRLKKLSERHYQVRAEVWSHSFFRLAVSFQSEWQHAIKDRWYRSSGHIFIRLDNFGLVKEFCLSTNGRAIQANERSIGFNR